MTNPPRCTEGCPLRAIWETTGVLQDDHYWHKPGQGGYLAHTQELEQRLNAPRLSEPHKPLQTSLWTRIQKLEEFAQWAADLEIPSNPQERTIVLATIIGRAQAALSD